MAETESGRATKSFLKSLGFPEIGIHNAFNHFDFRRPGRRILVIGSMGSGKTEFSARVWRDAQVALKKSGRVAEATSTNGADRRQVFFIRSSLDRERFPDYPADALPFRGGFEKCGQRIADIDDSFKLEELINKHKEIGTWIIDEAAFYEERLAFVVQRASVQRSLTFIFPTLMLNFRKEIFNPTARLLLETATDIFPLTAYCEHPDCIEDSFYTYRYYLTAGVECPALYFDPLIIIGGDREKRDPREPNYCTRCDLHHYLPGKEYTFLLLKPMGLKASTGEIEPLESELRRIAHSMEESELYSHFRQRYLGENNRQPIMMQALKVPCIAEKALIFLFAEQNLLTREQLIYLALKLELDKDYLNKRLSDNGRSPL